MWYMGMYVQSAVSAAIEHNFAGKRAKSKYIEKPIMESAYEDEGLPQEEIDERELKKMLLYEDMWAMQAKRKGLPETELL